MVLSSICVNSVERMFILHHLECIRYAHFICTICTLNIRIGIPERMYSTVMNSLIIIYHSSLDTLPGSGDMFLSGMDTHSWEATMSKLFGLPSEK